ncbi:MAG: hypothetical protein PWP04_1898 [Candidatus Atribacteria bacterium]|nr:hypothetical protein [Candidatus Atribacteria bacterium]
MRIIKEVEKVVFENGLVLLLIPQEQAPLFSVSLCLGMGNLYESKGEEGISSLLQETMVKGTEKQSASQFNLTVEGLGATISSSANYFTGRLALEGPTSEWSAILHLFLEVLKTPALSEKEMEREKEFLINLLRSADDDPLKASLRRFKKAFYGNHPFALSSIGREEGLRGITQKQLIDWYRQIYVPNNMVISVVGGFPADRAREILEKEMGSAVPAERPKPVVDDKEFAPAGWQIVDEKDITDSWLVLGSSAPDLLSVRERVIFEVLNNILGGAMYSRLFLRIREEKGLSYQVGSLYSPLLGPSFICAYCGFLPQYFELVLDNLKTEFRRLTVLDKDEWEEAKNYTWGLLLHSLETVHSVASLTSFYEKLGLGWDFPFTYQQILGEATLAEAQEVASNYLGDQKYSIGAVVPVKRE